MDRFVLTADLLTGVPDIDEQHRTLLELGNRVVDPSAADQSDALFREALSFLVGYTMYHFAAEEHVMRNAGYPRFEQHRRSHERFREKVADLATRARVLRVERGFRVEVSFAIENWLLEHIRITDRDLAAFLRQSLHATVVRLPDVRTLKEAGALPSDFDEKYAVAS